MYLKYLILVHNGLVIINFSSIIGRRNLIFVPIDFSVWNKDFCISYDPYLKVWFSVLSLVLSIIFIKVLDGSGFELHFSICSRRKVLCIIHFSRPIEVKIKLNHVCQVLSSHPAWSRCHQFLFHHWSEKSNFCTNRFVCLKRRFWYIIWPPIFKFDFRCYLWSSVPSILDGCG